jgi:soluble lytic murein transglycosylase
LATIAESVTAVQMILFPVRLLLTALLLLALPPATYAATLDLQNYRRAFGALDAGHPEEAYAFAHGHDPVLNKVLLASYMASPGNDIGFSEMANFIAGNPDWPGLRAIAMIAEQKMPSNATQGEVIQWFTAHPPITLMGFYLYIDALNATGKTQNVSTMIRTRWVKGDFNGDELLAFQARFERFLDMGTQWNRMDRYLWKNDPANVRRLYVFADSNMRAVAEARLALANQNPGASDYLSRVSSEWQGEPGLLYERLRWNIRNNHDNEAVDILRHAPENLGNPEAWWDQRQVEIRRAMERGEFDLAYQLAANHGQLVSKTLIQGEFLAGWLALRFLNKPEDAEVRFQTLYDNASTPISRARGAYWLGRSYEALGVRTEAEQAYETAAALDITYYGQLAATRLYAAPLIQAKAEPTIPPKVRNAFYSRDIIRAVQRLAALGETDRARNFFKAATDAAQQRVDFVLLTELALQIEHPSLAIEAAKAANQKDMLIAANGFPLLNRPVPRPPEPAFTHALIRQESMFNPQASSSAGAHGLMQLMPGTAKDVARKINVKYNPRQLSDPDYNLRLGTAFAQSQIDAFGGSYILALAGYNAGPRRVREWVAAMGDPRSPTVDAIDWIEMIPIAETRNYVQRIIESLQVYRAKLNGGQAPLMILKDLKR